MIIFVYSVYGIDASVEDGRLEWLDEEGNVALTTSEGIALIVLSDLIPVAMQILYLFITYWGEWDVLVVDYLKAPSDDDKTTDAGTVMLGDLKDELERYGGG